MSASLFYDCYADYETYPNTHKDDIDKTFGEIKEGDILYLLCYTKDSNKKDYYFKIINLTVEKPWHEARGHYFITCLEGKNKTHYINFGPTNIWNIEHESKNSSIIHYNSDIVGTNKENLINYKKQLYKNEIDDLNRVIESKQFYIDKLNQIKL